MRSALAAVLLAWHWIVAQQLRVRSQAAIDAQEEWQ